MVATNPESSSVSLCAQDDSPGSLPEGLSPRRASSSPEGAVPLPSSLANIHEDTTDSEPEEEAGRKSCEDSGSERENEGERSKHGDGHRLGSAVDENNDDGDDDQDYDEVVVKLRPLNEVTSLTDKTSPWTSVLSDLDTVSLESMEESSRAHLSPAVGEKVQVLNPQTSASGDQNGSAGDSSDPDCGKERTRRLTEESLRDLSHGRSSLPQKQEDKQPQTYPYCAFAAAVGAAFVST